jgi:hypothetical protein
MLESSFPLAPLESDEEQYSGYENELVLGLGLGLSRFDSIYAEGTHFIM